MLLLKDCMYKSNKDANDEDGDDGVKVKSTNSVLLSLFILFFENELQDLIEMTMKKMDQDKDGRVSFSDFSETVQREPLMMEAFGNCLPTSQAGKAFVSRILDQKSASHLLLQE